MNEILTMAKATPEGDAARMDAAVRRGVSYEERRRQTWTGVAGRHASGFADTLVRSAVSGAAAGAVGGIVGGVMGSAAGALIGPAPAPAGVTVRSAALVPAIPGAPPVPPPVFLMAEGIGPGPLRPPDPTLGGPAVTAPPQPLPDGQGQRIADNTADAIAGAASAGIGVALIPVLAPFVGPAAPFHGPVIGAGIGAAVIGLGRMFRGR